MRLICKSGEWSRIPSTHSGAIALVDCNNFYASCERLFRPDLAGKPVVALSNNDGCVVARSEEAKALGIPMAKPYHELKRLLDAHNVLVFSSNYALYGDISNRVMTTLKKLCEDVEVYSIDEAFLELRDANVTPFAQALNVKQRVERCVGVPVSIGVAPSKTLAKLANRIAKRQNRRVGVVSLMAEAEQTRALKDLPVENLWGIAGGFTRRLSRLGVRTALELRDLPTRIARKKIGVIMERMVYELRGIPSIEMEMLEPKRKSILCSRSFGKRLRKFEDVAETVAMRMSRAAEKLRAQDLFANQVGVFLRTNAFNEFDAQYNKSAMLTMPAATSNTSILIKYAMLALRRIFEKGYRYQKSGVFLEALENASSYQASLFDNEDKAKSARLMTAIDKINKTCGRHSAQFAACGAPQKLKIWALRQNFHSPHWTTSWQDLPVAKAN